MDKWNWWLKKKWKKNLYKNEVDYSIPVEREKLLTMSVLKSPPKTYKQKDWENKKNNNWLLPKYLYLAWCFSINKYDEKNND